MTASVQIIGYMFKLGINLFLADVSILYSLKTPENTAQKLRFPIKDFFSKCDQIRIFLRIWSNLLKKSSMENFIFCAVKTLGFLLISGGLKRKYWPEIGSKNIEQVFIETCLRSCQTSVIIND